MALTETGGSTSVTAGGGETTLYDSGSVAVNNWAFTLFTDIMGSGDAVTLKVYKKDATAGTVKLVYTFSVSGTQTEAIEVPYISATQFKVTLTLTGTTRTFNWNRYNM